MVIISWAVAIALATFACWFVIDSSRQRGILESRIESSIRQIPLSGSLWNRFRFALAPTPWTVLYLAVALAALWAAQYCIFRAFFRQTPGPVGNSYTYNGEIWVRIRPLSHDELVQANFVAFMGLSLGAVAIFCGSLYRAAPSITALVSLLVGQKNALIIFAPKEERDRKRCDKEARRTEELTRMLVEEARRRPVKAARRASRRCINCGGPLKRSDFILGREKHRQCTAFSDDAPEREKQEPKEDLFDDAEFWRLDKAGESSFSSEGFRYFVHDARRVFVSSARSHVQKVDLPGLGDLKR